MVDFVVTIRSKNGSLEERAYTANDRAELFKQLAADGVSAVRVNEGAVGKKPRKAASSGAPSKGRGLIAAAIVVLVAGIAAWWMWPEEKKVEEEKKRPKDTKSELVEKTSRKELNEGKKGIKKDVIKSESKRVSKDAALSDSKRIVEIVSVVTNADGSVYERFRTADGKLRSRQSAPKAVFDNSSDQLIAMALAGAESGGSMPPMPMSSSAEEDFVKSLKKEIVINDDDPEHIKNIKRSVMATRQQIHEMMTEGKSFADILRDHQELVNNNAALRAEAKAGLDELFKSGDREAAEEYLKRANELLRESGAAELEMPLTKEERRRLILERQNNQAE